MIRDGKVTAGDGGKWWEDKMTTDYKAWKAVMGRKAKWWWEVLMMVKADKQEMGQGYG